MIYRLYDYLKENAVGYENRIKSYKLMKVFGIKRNDAFRRLIQEIRQDETLQKIVCSEAGKNGGYWIATTEDEVNATMDHLYKRAMEMLKTYESIKRKSKLDRQFRFKFRKYEKGIFESILRK
jgi:hypothetical protein